MDHNGPKNRSRPKQIKWNEWIEMDLNGRKWTEMDQNGSNQTELNKVD